MEKTTKDCGCKTKKEGEAMEERCARANEVCEEACENCGLEVSSWEDFSARQEFIEGRIDENELTSRAASEVDHHAQIFGKYLVIDKEEPEASSEEDRKKDRARQANKIYRKVCDEAEMTLCFFSDFSSWSDYVKGTLSDTELFDRAKDEAQRIAEVQ
jgi:glucose-6-phosphate 1-dehydrogenase